MVRKEVVGRGKLLSLSLHCLPHLTSDGNVCLQSSSVYQHFPLVLLVSLCCIGHGEQFQYFKCLIPGIGLWDPLGVTTSAALDDSYSPAR